MKNLKILLLLITFSSVSQSAMLYDQIDRCIESYYSNNGVFYYYRSDSPNTLRSLTTNKTHWRVIPGYNYDEITGNCTPNDANTLGMEQTHFNFLMGLSGLFFSTVVALVISSFLVGL